MERGIKECDYFILLWTKQAQEKNWVQVEWEAALGREMLESRTFLIVGRLEDHPPPILLRSRLFIDLFPSIQFGISKFIDLIRRDQEAGVITDRKVLPPKVDLVEDDDANGTIYVTSELFGVTIPIKTNLDIPSGVKLTQLINDLELPNQVAYQDKFGYRLNYRLVTKGGIEVESSNSFKYYGIVQGDVLWLEANMVPFHKAEPIEGELQTVTFRGGDNTNLSAKIFATQQLNLAIKRAGLNSPK